MADEQDTPSIFNNNGITFSGSGVAGAGSSPCLQAGVQLSRTFANSVEDWVAGIPLDAAEIFFPPIAEVLGPPMLAGLVNDLAHFPDMTPNDKLRFVLGAGMGVAANRLKSGINTNAGGKPPSQPSGKSSSGGGQSGGGPSGGGPSGGGPSGGGPSGGSPSGGGPPGGRPEANPVQFQQYKDQLRREMGKPHTSGNDPEVTQWMDAMYRDDATVGSGSSADAARHEQQTGEKVGGKLHTQKIDDAVKPIAKWLRNNPAPLKEGEALVPNAPASSDRAAMENVLQDIWNAKKGR